MLNPQRSSSALAFICHPYHRGGVTRWMVDAAGEWRARHHETWFVVPRAREPFANGAGRPPVTELLDALSPDRQPARVEPVVGAEYELGTAAYRADVYVRAALRSVPPGVPIVVSDDAAAWDAGATLAERNPFVGVLHADDVWYYGLTRRYRTSVSSLVAVSERVAWKTREIVRGLPTPVVTIPCGISIPAEVPVEGSQRQSVTRLVWMGRIDERQKRVSDLPAIAEELSRRGFPFELEIIGDGYDVPLIQRGLSAATAAAVHFHGWLPAAAVSRMLASADVLLLPSNFEGMPLAGMEALAHGCAVVASSASGLEEYRERPDTRECLWIHPVGGIEAAVHGVQAAARVHPARRRASARTFASTEFAIAVCMDRYAGMLGRLEPRVGHAPVRRRLSVVTRLVSAGVATARRGRRWLASRRANKQGGEAAPRPAHASAPAGREG